ncbi:uncharacterized protein ASPGLDRAFT_26978 [Aspergillus glaucus CBS 516.65]|uniref:Major facilitator superfamily (MFS) profile domain-containing protein n=1 Tax=Aspergillus glaucus CBS 516.65 TaxID=1160497 RepID=A0A1L9VFP4_ASPGL|nr:hypothetical protein ASPGLDRAFT_26978 [Aspergillus glaucus CBS 516.65]OJJ82736.1 hypothetical protein ASPGLDRAFT_26978 [Aspergillus glaucus CBS 516.65]
MFLSSQGWIRGTIVGAYQLAITIGLLVAAIVNNATKDRDNTGSYRIPVAVQFVWAIILVAGMLVLPETPRFLIKQDKHEAAAKSLARLRRIDIGDQAIVEELAEIQANHDYEMSVGKATYLEIFRGSIGRRLATGCGVQALQQLAGVNFIFYYGTTFFEHSGIKDGFIITLITNIVNVVSTFPGLYMVEKWGRQPLLMFGAVSMCVSQLIVAIVGTATSSDVSNKVLIAFLVGACCLGGDWRALFSQSPCQMSLQSKVFFIWGGFCFIAAVFVYTCIYETKGLSLEEVDELYHKVPVAWKSKGFVPSSNYADMMDALPCHN